MNIFEISSRPRQIIFGYILFFKVLITEKMKLFLEWHWSYAWSYFVCWQAGDCWVWCVSESYLCILYIVLVFCLVNAVLHAWRNGAWTWVSFVYTDNVLCVYIDSVLCVYIESWVQAWVPVDPWGMLTLQNCKTIKPKSGLDRRLGLGTNTMKIILTRWDILRSSNRTYFLCENQNWCQQIELSLWQNILAFVCGI